MNCSRIVILATLVSLTFLQPVSAAIIFSGTAFNPEASANASGSASFSIAGNTLKLALTNLTNPRTTAQGNTLTGVAFDIGSASPALTLTSTALTAGSSIWTSKTSSNTTDPVAGSWTTVLGNSPLAAYGVATTGFNDRFNGGSMALGNASPNYGIVAAGTFDGTNVSFGGSQFPFIQKSMTFTFTGVSGISESQIKNVKFLFGTAGSGIGTGMIVPEPGSFVFLSLACASAIWARCRKR
jgi:hypothetical protein